MNKKVQLIILDGWGIPKLGEEWRSAIEAANVPYFRHLMATFPNSTLEASGRAVGLPIGQMGNSEVGHTNLGAGRIVYQELEKINVAVEEGLLAKEKVIIDAIQYAKSNSKKFHLIGLCSDGGVHSHIDHLKGLCQLVSDAGVKDVLVHAFMDGRDCDPKSGKACIADLQNSIAGSSAKIASLTGRYFAMDRDKRWDRVKLAYDAMVNGIGECYVAENEILDCIQKSYDANITDEFLKPIVVVDNGKAIGNIENSDVVMCFNFSSSVGSEIKTHHHIAILNISYCFSIVNYHNWF